MRTRRLFDEDPHLCEFDATVVAVRPEGPWIALDRTAFFPEDGGQRADVGTLGEVPVIELAADGGGAIWHRLEVDPGWTPGTAVRGRVDPAHRRDHRQQHSGQHILSRAYVQVLGAATKGFHMGEDLSTIDIEASRLDWATVRAVEDRANLVVVENRTVQVRAEERGDDLPLRTVTIDRFDEQHCCGTHVTRTGEIGLIKVLRWEKVRNLTRVTFVCGDRSLLLFQRLLEAADGAARAFSSGWLDLPAAASGALEQLRLAERQLRAWQERWALLEAERLAREAPRDSAGVLRVVAWIDGAADVGTLRAAANAILAHGRAVVVLAGPGSPGKRPWVAGRTEDLPDAAAEDASVRLAGILSGLGGRGGGSALFAQGSCPAEEEACRRALARISASGG